MSIRSEMVSGLRMQSFAPSLNAIRVAFGSFIEESTMIGRLWNSILPLSAASTWKPSMTGMRWSSSIKSGNG